MTEISYEGPYYVAAYGSKPEKPLQNEYHWVTPAIPAQESAVVPQIPEAKVVGYDCTQPKGGPV